MIYGTFDLSTGEQLSYAQTSVTFDLSGIPDAEVIPSAEMKYYLDLINGTVMEKTSFSLISDSAVVADGVDIASISNIPNPTTVTWPDGVVTEVTGGEIGFTTDQEGDHVFKFESVQHITEEVTIVAQPST